MRIYLVILTAILFLSCSLLTGGDKETNPYEWRESNWFYPRWISAVAVGQNDELFIATDNKLYVSENRGQNFQRIMTPDSADIVKIRDFGEKLFIIGNVYRPEGGDWGRDVSSLYYSEDRGASWEELIGGFIMQDVAYTVNKVHIGRKHGVTTIDLVTGELTPNSFIYSRLSDHIEEIEASVDGRIFLASHDGVHHSEDEGQSWEKISTLINSNDDFVRSIETDENGIFYGVENRHLYIKEKGEGSWQSYVLRSGSDQLKLLPDNKLAVMGLSRLMLADRTEMRFKEIQPKEKREEGGPYFAFLDAFSNGDLVLGGNDNLFIGRKK